MKKKIRFAKKVNLTKARFLAPIFKRYRPLLSLKNENKQLWLISSDIVVTNDHKIAFVKNSKSGCTTVAQMIYYINYGEFFTGDIHNSNTRLIQGRMHIPTCFAALRDENAYKFTFVRHPMSRVISAFHNFVFEKSNSSAVKHLKLMEAFGYHKDADPTQNFDAFLNYIESSFAANRDYTDPHFRMQVLNTALGHVAYDYIGKIETYAQDMEHILRAAGVWHDAYHDLLNVKANQSKKKPYQPTSEQTRRVEALYAEDYRAFGYPKASVVA